MSIINKISETKSVKFILASGGSLAGLAGFVGDVLLPLQEIGGYVLFFSILIILISFVLKFATPALDRKLNRSFEYWFGPFVMAVMVFGLGVYGLQLASKTYGADNNGITGTLIPEIQDFQKFLGIIQQQNEELIGLQKESNEHLKESKQIQSRTEALIAQGNAQRDLVVKGTFWKVDTLSEAMILGDLSTLEIFRTEGRNLSMVSQPIMNQNIHNAIVVDAIYKNHSTIDEVLNYLSSHDFIDLNGHFQVSNQDENIYLLWTKHYEEIDQLNASRIKQVDQINQQKEKTYEKQLADYEKNKQQILSDFKKATEQWKKKYAAYNQIMKKIQAIAGKRYANMEKDAAGNEYSLDELVEIVRKEHGNPKKPPAPDHDMMRQKIALLVPPSKPSQKSTNIYTPMSSVNSAKASLFTIAQWSGNTKAMSYLKAQKADAIPPGTIVLSNGKSIDI